MSQEEQKPEELDQLSFRCRICKVVQGDFWYHPAEDCCCDCMGIDPEVRG